MSRSKTVQTLNAIAFNIGIIIIAVVANDFAAQPALRTQFDATKTRAYSLSERSHDLLDSLDGQWSVTLVLIEDEAEPTVLRQVDEVLRRYDDASSQVSVSRIDPTDPSAIGRYESLLNKLQSAYAEPIAAYDKALEDGVAGFKALQTFAQIQTPQLAAVIDRLPQQSQQRRVLQNVRSALLEIVNSGDEVLEAIAEFRRTDAGQPIADYEGARSTFHATHSHWADQLYQVTLAFQEWSRQAEEGAALLQYTVPACSRYEQLAQQLKRAADALSRLPRLELNDIGKRLREGEAAIVMGPNRAAVIPSWQLFPKTVRQSGGGDGTRGAAISFDRRFRGEQLITATIQSLLVEQMPMVVFLHAEDRSLFRSRAQRLDLLGMRDALRSQRFDVHQWRIGGGNKPTPADGQPVVWVVVPPTQRQGLKITERENQLIEEVRRLISAGEPVLLTLSRSLLPTFRREDPWAKLTEPLGLTVQTGKVVYESLRVSEEKTETRPYQIIRSFPSGSVIADSLNGRATFFHYPMPIEIDDTKGDQTRVTVLAEVTPAANRWLEDDWRGEPQAASAPQVKRFDRTLPLAVAATLRDPVESGKQRMVVIGSGGWLFSAIADVTASLGGQRQVLLYPGNRELMVNSVAWLAGREDLIAPGSTGREIPRLRDVTESTRAGWGWITIAGMPAASLLLGIGIWIIRRR